MQIHQITAQAGSHKRRKRVGRGESSGHGKTCGRGHKGYKARSGPGPHPLHEGGQMPVFRRLPKRGFSNAEFRRRFEIVNIGELQRRFDDGQEVTIELLRQCRLVQGDPARVKILADGKLTKKLTVEAHAISAAAKQAIEQVGGSVRLVELPDPAVQWKLKRGKGGQQQRVSRLEKKKQQRQAAEN